MRGPRIAAWSCALCLSSTAAFVQAQTTSDLMPSPPASGAGSVYYPGMPVPQASPRNNSITNTRSSGTESPRGFFVSEDSVISSDRGAPSEAASPNATPDTHVVRKGDTLWDISATYFNNPYYWPKLWAFNPSITNPHWIYPGDVVRLALPGQAPTALAPTLPKRAGLGVSERRPISSAGLFLRQTGFVEPGELSASGKIIGSREEKIMLATLDEAYVEFRPENPMQVGERYSVYMPIRQVRHPVTGKRVGDIVQIFGEVEVKSVTKGHIARVLIVDSTSWMERSYRVGPLRRQFRMVNPKPAAQNLNGVVLTTMRPQNLVGTEELVFIDRGKRDGVELGNRFSVVRRGDGYQPLLAKGPVDDKRFPRETIAEAVVIDVRDQIATAMVTQAQKEARVGDRVEVRLGQ